jgi:hypothetical protein
MFTGATRYNGLRDWLILARRWGPFVKRMKAMPGYCWHKVYWEPPFTLGTLAYFETREDLLRMARTPEHRHLMRWVTGGTEHATAGFIRLFVADAHGYTNGIWRAEDQSMDHIETYTPLLGDDGPRRVDDAASELT